VSVNNSGIGSPATPQEPAQKARARGGATTGIWGARRQGSRGIIIIIRLETIAGADADCEGDSDAFDATHWVHIKFKCVFGAATAALVLETASIPIPARDDALWFMRPPRLPGKHVYLSRLRCLAIGGEKTAAALIYGVVFSADRADSCDFGAQHFSGVRKPNLYGHYGSVGGPNKEFFLGQLDKSDGFEASLCIMSVPQNVATEFLM